MLEILNLILPVFILMACGYGAVKIGILKEEYADALNAVSVRLAVPVLLFRAIYNLDFGKAIQVPMLLAFYFGVVASFIIGIVISRKIFNRRPGEAVSVGFSAMFSNTVLLGLPIAERAFGSDQLPLVFGIIAFHAPCLYILGMISMEISRSDGRGIFQTLKIALSSVLANSLMIGIMLGAILNIFEVPLLNAIEVSVDMIASAAIPLALLGIGASLPKYKIKSEISETIAVSAVQLLIHPGIVFILAYFILSLPIEFVQIAVIVAAMPPGVNIYVFSTMYNRAVALSASAIVVATLTSIFTISGWLWLLMWL